MTPETKANLAASVAARLLNRAKQTGDDYQTLLTSKLCHENAFEWFEGVLRRVL